MRSERDNKRLLDLAWRHERISHLEEELDPIPGKLKEAAEGCYGWVGGWRRGSSRGLRMRGLIVVRAGSRRSGGSRKEELFTSVMRKSRWKVSHPS